MYKKESAGMILMRRMINNMENYSIMAHSDESASSSTSQVPLLTTIDMTTPQYKKTVESLSSEIFNIHTSMIAAKIHE